MKRIQSLLTIFFTLFVAIAVFSFHAEAAVAPVYDNAKLLSQDEKEKLTAEIRRIEEKYNVHIGIVTQTSMQGRHIGHVANALLDKGYRGAPNGSMALLISVDPKKREWYISTDTRMQIRITNDKGIQYIADRMTPYLKKGDYFKGLAEYVSAVEDLLGLFFG